MRRARVWGLLHLILGCEGRREVREGGRRLVLLLLVLLLLLRRRRRRWWWWWREEGREGGDRAFGCIFSASKIQINY